MKIRLLTLLFVVLALGAGAQITLTGHTMMNRSPVKNVNVVVKADGVTTKTLSTGNKSEFSVVLDFGKLYNIYVQYAASPVMFVEVKANEVPVDKQDYRMRYEMNVPFVPKNDEDVDTTVFSTAPFHKVIFNGKNMMVDDAAYNNAFLKTIIKKPVKKEEKPEPVAEIKPAEVKEEPKEDGSFDNAIIAGKIIMNGDKRLTITNRKISLLNKNNEVVKQTSTNRYGAFVFTGIRAADVAKMRMDANEGGKPDVKYEVVTSKGKNVARCTSAGGSCEWSLSEDDVKKLVDNNYSINIGGKLVISSAKEKKFFSNKTVYLSNKLNTILRETKTNVLGTFVFEDIKPDHNYYISVDKSELLPGQKVDVLSKEDNYIATLDTVMGGKSTMKINSGYNKQFNELSVGDDEMKMDIKATIYGDNVSHPIGKLKVILLNDNYEVIDSAVTDDLGTFKFKYLPFLKRFYLSAENTESMLDVFKNILIYSSDENLIKIMTHQKGKRFQYKPVSAELSRMREVEIDDPWLDLMGSKRTAGAAGSATTAAQKSIVENILFEAGKYDITPQAKDILDKVTVVLTSNKQLRIEIGAHTDSKGNEAGNMKLSQLRAKTVSDYITARGIEKSRIIAKGYGESKLLNNCGDNQNCSEIEHAQNRRIEFKILGQ